MSELFDYFANAFNPRLIKEEIEAMEKQNKIIEEIGQEMKEEFKRWDKE